jgi:YHS domain-containing protein
VFISVTAFAVIAASSTTYVYGGVTYYHVNPWYRRVMHEGEEGYVPCTAPVGHEQDQLPEGSETVEVDGKTYYYADTSFWQKAAAGGYVVVQPPVGAEVSSVPDEAQEQKEGDVTLYQFDTLFFTQDTNSVGQTIYRVEPQPPEEEIDSIPAGSPSFVADGETYYYVNYSFYVEFEENGKTGFVNGAPEIGAQVDELPGEVTTLVEDDVTYYQFDSVFFEQVEDDNDKVFYEVVGSPDGSDQEVEN